MGIPVWAWMIFVPAIAFLAGLTVVAALVRLVLFCARARPRRFFRPFYRAHLIVVPLSILICGPVALAYFATHRTLTRGDETFYSGPSIGQDGGWIRVEKKRGREAESESLQPNPYAVSLRSSDGVRVRGYFVPPPSGTPTRAVAVIVHGLFRGAWEIEPVGMMFRELGVAVLLLELRNHGASDAAVCTFGDLERRDVIAAAAYVRSRPETANLPLVLFGVSLGSAAVSLALDAIDPPPAAVVLDSPMASLRAAAERLLGDRIAMPQPFRWTLELGLSWVGGVRFDATVPAIAVASLDPSIRLLVIGCEKDETMPPGDAKRVFDAASVTNKELWIVPGAGHGKAWTDAKEEYRARLKEQIDAIAP